MSSPRSTLSCSNPWNYTMSLLYNGLFQRWGIFECIEMFILFRYFVAFPFLESIPMSHYVKIPLGNCTFITCEEWLEFWVCWTSSYWNVNNISTRSVQNCLACSTTILIRIQSSLSLFNKVMVDLYRPRFWELLFGFHCLINYSIVFKPIHISYNTFENGLAFNVVLVLKLFSVVSLGDLITLMRSCNVLMIFVFFGEDSLAIAF